MIVGVAGTAKNTGKTTTLCALIDEACRRGRLPGVTGIGYDGEERDNVTLLPKPRITVHPGMIVTTSERCLPASTARLRIVHRTGLHTALGEVLITRVDKEGLAVVAGPNKTADLVAVSRQVASLGVADLLVDGSLNRIAPMAVADRIVFATGGARSTDMTVLAEDTAAIERIFSYPAAPAGLRLPSGLRLQTKDTSVHRHPGAVQDARVIAQLLERVPAGLTDIVLPGLVTPEALGVLSDRLASVSAQGVRVVFDDPFKVLLAGEPVRVGVMLHRLDALGIQVCYRHAAHLAAVTFNPYYPAFDGTTYRAATLDPASSRAALAAVLATPVIDVQAQGSERIYDACFP